MKQKVLVTGFQRSGTTLLGDLLRATGVFTWVLHESRLMLGDKINKLQGDGIRMKVPVNPVDYGGRRVRVTSENVTFDPFGVSWAEKVPYYHDKIADCDEAIEIVEYFARFNSLFGPESRIINIIRNPFDVGISTKVAGYSENHVLPIERWVKVVPRVSETIKELGGLNVFYEELVAAPFDVLSRIFLFLGFEGNINALLENMDASELSLFDGVAGDRGFAFKNRPNFNRDRIFKRVEGLKEALAELSPYRDLV